MQASLVRRCSIVGLLLAALACAEAAAPAPRAPVGQLEPLSAVIAHRLRHLDERLPNIAMFGYDGTLEIRVTRLALCNTQVQAGVSRSDSSFDVVAVLGSDPAALCAVNDGRAVVEYHLRVPRVALGLYDVRVFEGEYPRHEPRFIGQSRTWVHETGH